MRIQHIIAVMRNIKGRLKIWLSVGLLVLIGALAYERYFLARPVGVGPAGPAVPLEPFRSVWTERSVKLVGIGDSITAGLGAKSTEHSYFARLIRNPSDEYDDMEERSLSLVLPNLTSENFAVSGSRSDAHLTFIEERLEKQGEDVFGLVVMTTGGNDLIHSYGRFPPKENAMYGATLSQAEPWIESFRVRLTRMLDLIDEAFPGGCEIYVGDIYDPTDGVGDAPSIYLPPWPDGLKIHARYNETIRVCSSGRSNVHVVPLYATFLGHGSHCRQFWRSTYDSKDPHYWFYTNIEDPNDRGYDAIRRLYLNAILEKSQLVPSSTNPVPKF